MKVAVYEMICTNNITGQKLKCKVMLEAGEDTDESLGEVQSNFLWETFGFETTKLEEIELAPGAPLTVYSDVVAIE